MIQRPIHLNLFTLHFPFPAIISIVHRLSGMVLFFAIPGLLWLLEGSLASETQFTVLETYFQSFWVYCLTWGLLSALGYHWIAGLRHLLLDIHIGESKSCAQKSAIWVAVAFLAMVAVLGYVLWA